ncbi:MAG: aminotransferase class I/II-fold pyridoxal phosphate-dependent enzyme [Patescibacteria group bacterium]|jgi:dTDP-4-amino-4,6-dideoxygalactose transaminase
MSIFTKTIFTGFAPNLTGRDTRSALSYLLLPWRWLKISSGKYTVMAEKKLREYFNIKHAYVFDSGRSALYYALKALGAGEGDEVLMQAYTCVVVVNAIKFTGAKPIFIDINNTFNIDPADLEKRITPKTKILIIQHTFGLPANLDYLLAIAAKHNIKVIEDCAHSLGARYNGKLTGTFGHIGMLSFGSDKIISCVRGGALITNDNEIGNKIKQLSLELAKPKLGKTLQHLMHYPIFYISKPIYHLFIGKFILMLAKKLNVFNKIIYKKEKTGEQVNFYPAKLANSLAHILCEQINEIDELNAHRQTIAKYYSEHLSCHSDSERSEEEESLQPAIKTVKGFLANARNDNSNNTCAFLRYPLLTKNPKELLTYAKKQGIILGDWYSCVIAPCDSEINKTGYHAGDCPNAERLAAESVNLPTDRHITEKQAEKIIKIINSYNN